MQKSGVYPENLNQGNIIIVKSERSDYRKYIIIEISKTCNNSSIKWVRCLYVVTYCLDKIVDIPSAVFYCQSRDTSPIENKVPGLELYWCANHEFYTRLAI